MNYSEQRKFALEIFKDIPQLCDTIREGYNCFNQIFEVAKTYRTQILKIVKNIEIPNYWAYLWARDIGDKDVMIKKITDSYWAYLWALNIGDKDVMIQKITDSYWAYYWARFIGNRDVMIEKITESEWAFRWAIDIGDHEIMRDRVTDPFWIQKWNENYVLQH